jgi:predicted amidohydrolase YtcJ
MRFRPNLALLAFTIAGPLFATSVVADDAVERLFYNARIFTAEPEHPYAEAVAIRGDKIVAVGSRVDVEKMVGKQAERVDLRGQWLLPGLIDSHTHCIQGGLSLISTDVGDKVHSVDDLVAFIAEAKKSGKGMRGSVLSISGMPLAFWSKTDELNANFSTATYADLPVYLSGSDYHNGNRAQKSVFIHRSRGST